MTERNKLITGALLAWVLLFAVSCGPGDEGKPGYSDNMCRKAPDMCE